MPRASAAQPPTSQSDILLTETNWGGRAYLQFLLPEKPILTTYRKTRLAFAGPGGTDHHEFLTPVYVPQPNETAHPKLTRFGDSGVSGKFNGKTFRIEFNSQGQVGGQISIGKAGDLLTKGSLQVDNKWLASDD